jgi:hypothetical protein
MVVQMAMYCIHDLAAMQFSLQIVSTESATVAGESDAGRIMAYEAEHGMAPKQ